MTTTKTLDITLSNGTTYDEQCWIALEQLDTDDTATTEEAAETIDELFELDPCYGDDEDDEDDDDEDTVDEDDLLETATDNLDEVLADVYDILCTEGDGSYTCQVKVTRSHSSKSYSLYKQNCRVTATQTGLSETISETVAVESASSLSDIEIPADQEVSATWAGKVYTSSGEVASKPTITVKGGNVYWRGSMTGVVKLSYTQPYELLSVTVDGEDGETPDAALTAIGYNAVDEITLDAPEQQEIDEDLCDRISESIDTDDEGSGCYKQIEHQELCDCSRKSNGSYTTYEDVDCGDHEPGSTVAYETETSFVTCDEEDDVHDPEFYKETCCQAWPFSGDLPRCRETYRTFSGVSLSADRRAEILAAWPNAQIVLVGPAQEPCGELVYEQDVQAKNCCDGVEELAIDEEESADTVGPGSWCDIWVTGGILPITWQIRGNGFYVDSAHQQRDITVNSRKLRIFTDETACGTCVIYATDGCSSINWWVRCTEGQWVAIDPADVLITGVAADEAIGAAYDPDDSDCLISATSKFDLQATVGPYRLRQSYYWTAADTCTTASAAIGSTTCDSDTSDTCTGSWISTAQEIAANHYLNDDEPMLINPATSAQAVVDWGNTYILSLDGDYTDVEVGNPGAGTTNRCVYGLDAYSHKLYFWRTKGGALFGCGSSAPLAWIWTC